LDDTRVWPTSTHALPCGSAASPLDRGPFLSPIMLMRYQPVNPLPQSSPCSGLSTRSSTGSGHADCPWRESEVTLLAQSVLETNWIMDRLPLLAGVDAPAYCSLDCGGDPVWRGSVEFQPSGVGHPPGSAGSVSSRPPCPRFSLRGELCPPSLIGFGHRSATQTGVSVRRRTLGGDGRS